MVGLPSTVGMSQYNERLARSSFAGEGEELSFVL